MHHNQDLQNRLKILAFQPQIPITYTKEARQAHVDRMIATLEKSIAQQGAVDVVVLPELATIDYSRQAFDQLPDLAEKSEGDSFERLSTFAQHVGCTVVYGFARKEKGDYFISQNVINPAGRLVAGYDKLHAAHFGFSMEKDYFSTGQRLAVFQVGGFRFGIVICYDFRFPELTRLYA
ncbi:MAG: carbon-nitrogen hydrolase family protein [Chloroflexota bacterium]